MSDRLAEEFELLGAPFADRGARADDAMRALRRALSQPEPEYSGEFYDFAGFLVEPCAEQEHVPDVGRRPHVPVIAPRGRAR